MTEMSPTWIALLRAIGPATHKAMPMTQLREACEAAGFEATRTVLATGNVIFLSTVSPRQIKHTFDTIIAAHGLSNEVFLRRPEDLRAVLAENPFPDAALERPNHMLVLFMDAEPDAKAIATFGSHIGPERMRVVGKEVYIDYVEGVGRSKLTAARLERWLGQSGTARNWNTIQKLVSASTACS